MCGIYGAISFNRDLADAPALMSRMGSVIAHRGPDDEGLHIDGKVAIGMRRLSIIDLSGGHQPICNEDQSIWVVCNGEIYNFASLRGELQRKGHWFRTNSDTEVLVHLYEQEGLDFTSRLRGMFGFALWDSNANRLIVGRDRLGKKPLNIWQGPDSLLFASEIKSLLEHPQVSREVDPQALREYLALGYVPAPRTMFRGIRKLLPGHILVVDKGKIEERPYWNLRFDPHSASHSEEEWTDMVREKLLEAVKIRLVSDVPLGAFLSGGIDSSAIVAAMAHLSDRPVKTYSIGFEGEDQFYNELPYARIVADKFATEHHEIIVRPAVAELLPKLIWHLDEPIADSAFLTTYLVAKLARESVTVILSGVGGDELFGGYRRYLGEQFAQIYRKVPRPLRAVLPRLLSLLPQDRHSGWKNNIRYASAFVKSAELPELERYVSYMTIFSPELQSQLLGETGNAGTDPLAAYFGQSGSDDPLDQIIYADIKTSLADDLLALTDKATMAASIECRAPFMDHELVELAATMPSHLKVRGFTMKYILKKALEPWLPKEILYRKKRGFGAPVGAWLRRDLDSLVRDTLSPEQVRKRGFFNPEVVQNVIARHAASRNDYTDHLMALICFELWCRIYLDGEGYGQREACPAETARA